MKSILTSTLLFVVFSFQTNAEQTCQTTKDFLGAHYRFVISQVNDQENSQATPMKTAKLSSLWRTKQKVLTIDGEQSITWFKLSNGLVKKTAHFDHFKRSIEYPAKPMNDDRWQQIWQFIPNSQKQSLSLISSKQEGCYQHELYQWHNNETDLQGKLVWNADLNLVVSLTMTQGKKQSHWQLEKIEQDKFIIDQEFSQRDSYQATDFADIGDNESDPFLIKMINLGFIEHGASGVYNAQGEKVVIEHNH
tara:strand:+ start:8723 stop:9469 length:747 start_codon:yes stop_codon:yes gene_type:complete